MVSFLLVEDWFSQRDVAEVGHDHFMSQLSQQSADPGHPGRVHPGLQRDAAARGSGFHFLSV